MDGYALAGLAGRGWSGFEFEFELEKADLHLPPYAPLLNTTMFTPASPA
jgi:hypothetical protein